MKYMLLLYMGEDAMTEAERAHCYVESTELAHDLKARGQYLGANPLQQVSAATSVRVREGKRLVTDGPFAETKEQLGGILILEARDLEHAIQLMSKHPGVKFGPFEIRPVADVTEMIRESERRRAVAK